MVQLQPSNTLVVMLSTLGGGYKPHLYWVLPMSGFNNVLSILVYRTRSLFEPDFVMPEEKSLRSHFLPLSEGEDAVVLASASYKCGVRVQPVGNCNLGLPTQQSCHTAWGKCKDAQSQGLVADTHKRCNELHPTKLPLQMEVLPFTSKPLVFLQALKNIVKGGGTVIMPQLSLPLSKGEDRILLEQSESLKFLVRVNPIEKSWRVGLC